MVNDGAARAAATAACVRKACWTLVFSVLAALALGQPSAQAGTWLDQRFYDDPPRSTHSGGWTMRAATEVPTSHHGRSRSKHNRRLAHSRGGAENERGSRRGRSYRVASLGNDVYDVSPPSERFSGPIRWVASSGCLADSLRSVIHQVAANFGSVTVSSTCRSRRHNARVGGAHRSYHLSGNAADFRVRGDVSGAYAFLRASASVGGLKHYGGGLFHIDTGARRTW